CSTGSAAGLLVAAVLADRLLTAGDGDDGKAAHWAGLGRYSARLGLLARFFAVELVHGMSLSPGAHGRCRIVGRWPAEAAGSCSVMGCLRSPYSRSLAGCLVPSAPIGSQMGRRGAEREKGAYFRAYSPIANCRASRYSGRGSQ